MTDLETRVPCSCDQSVALTETINKIVYAFESYLTQPSEDPILALENAIDESTDLVRSYKRGEKFFRGQ